MDLKVREAIELNKKKRPRRDAEGNFIPSGEKKAKSKEEKQLLGITSCLCGHFDRCDHH